MPVGATVLALGGASWSRLGSNGAWVDLLAGQGVAVRAAAAGQLWFDVPDGWSRVFADRLQASRSSRSRCASERVRWFRHLPEKGEFVATASGVEGSLIYARVGVLVREEITRNGQALVAVDLQPIAAGPVRKRKCPTPRVAFAVQPP